MYRKKDPKRYLRTATNRAMYKSIIQSGAAGKFTSYVERIYNLASLRSAVPVALTYLEIEESLREELRENLKVNFSIEWFQILSSISLSVKKIQQILDRGYDLDIEIRGEAQELLSDNKFITTYSLILFAEFMKKCSDVVDLSDVIICIDRFADIVNDIHAHHGYITNMAGYLEEIERNPDVMISGGIENDMLSLMSERFRLAGVSR